MKKTYRAIALASVLALGLSSITIPSAQADPPDQPTQATGFTATPQVSVVLGTKTPDSTEVRLITGDIVYVDKDGQVTGATPGPRPDGAVPQLGLYNAEPGSYVIPSDVASMVDNQLDRELFNVTRLAAYDLGEDSVPVIVAPGEDAPDVTPDVSDMGVEVTGTLEVVAAQAGIADANTDSGPAPSWDLIAELDTAPTSAADPVSSNTKVWLDRKVQVDPSDELDPEWTPPVWMDVIGATDAHAAGYTGEGVLVAVVDTGIDSNHPDLAGQVVAAQDFSGSGTPEDVFGHGTFVASEIAGTGAASDGVYVGVAPAAKLINARVLDDSGSGLDSSIIAGVEWAAQQGADIINMSLGDSSIIDDGSSLMSQAINRISRQYGALIVVAAGNAGAPQSVSSPGTADEALTVGATYQDGSQTWFSSIGPRRGDGTIKPEIMAPGAGLPIFDESGVMIDVTGIMGADVGSGGYISEMGTSMSAPLVAGSAALVKQSDPSLDRTSIRAKLMASATPLEMSVFEQGAGMVNIPAAIDQVLTTSPTQVNFGGFPLPYPDSTTATLSYSNQGSEDLTLDLTSSVSFTENLGLPTQVEIEPPMVEAAGPVAALALQTEDASQIALSADVVVVPAQGTASVELTIDPSAFEAGYIGGYVIATSADGAEIRTPIGWGNQPRTVTLSVTATDNLGAPISDGVNAFVSVLDVHTGIPQNVNAMTPTVGIQVIPGDYVVVAYSCHWNDDNYGWDCTHLVNPEISVTDDMAITMDGTVAQPITVDTEKPAYEGLLSLSIRYTALYAQGLGGTEWWSMSSVEAFRHDTFYLVPVDDPDWNIEAQAIMMSPQVEASVADCGAAPVPVEPLNTVLPAGQYSFTTSEKYETPATDAKQLAIVHADALDPWDPMVWGDRLAKIQDAGYAGVVVDSDRPYEAASGLRSLIDQYSWYVDSTLDIPVFVTSTDVGDQIRGSGSVNLLVHAQMDYAYLLWQELDPMGPFAVVASEEHTTSFVITHPGRGSADVEDRFRSSSTTFSWPMGTGFNLLDQDSYTAYVPTDRWNGISVLTAIGDEGTLTDLSDDVYSGDDVVDLPFGAQVQSPALSLLIGYIGRAGNVISGPVPMFIQGQNMFERDRSAGFGSVDLTLTDVTTGQTLISDDSNLAFFESPTLDPSSHTYRLDMETTSSLRTLSTDVTSSWTWQSSYADWRSEPLREMWYELPGLDADNAGSESQPVVVHTAQQISSEPLPAAQVSLEASTDGGSTWASVPVQFDSTVPAATGNFVDEDLYVGTIQAKSGQMVSLRSSISGGDSSFDQTVMNAYPVTDSPRNYPTPLTWSCGGDVTPPDAPRVDSANASAVVGGPGSAEPGSTVTVTFSDGTKGTDVANEDGSYSVATPADVRSGSVSVTATDAAGNVSDATTVYLDADRPDAPRIDRADTIEVSGGVGAAEASAQVLVAFPDGSVVTVQAQENGSYSVPTPAGMMLGMVTVIVQDEAGNVSDPSTAQLVEPSKVKVSVRSSQVGPGDSQTVTGSNFRGLERVTVSLCSVSSCSTVKTVYASLTGKVSTSFTVPKTSVEGTFTVMLTGATSGSGSASFDVVVPPPTPQCWLDYLLSVWLKLLGF